MDWDDDESGIGLALFGILKLFTLVTVIVLILGLIIAGALAATVKEKDPQAFDEFITNSLGVQGDFSYGTEKEWMIRSADGSPERGIRSVIEPFYTTYWNGGNVMFYVPEDVWNAAVAATAKYPRCDPRYSVSLAHSESSMFKNDVCSGVGACGTWQFMPGTWASYGQGGPDERYNLKAAAEAVCKYTEANGMIGALSDKQKFINEFAINPPVWNRHVGQAAYVWELYQQISENTELPEEIHAGNPFQVTKTWWKKPLVWILDQFGWLPATLAYQTDNIEFEPAEGDDKIAFPYQGIRDGATFGLHGQSYGHCAIDLAYGNGTKVFSPINGVVTQMYTDGLGNPVIRIENSVFIVELLHGNWNVKAGEKVSIGDHVGTESNQGNTWSNGSKCGTGSNCGYHTHFHAEVRGKTCVNPSTLVNTKLTVKNK